LSVDKRRLRFAGALAVAMALIGSAPALGAPARLVVPPAAFHPSDGTDVWDNGGSSLRGAGDFLAPLALPPGAQITKVTLFATDFNPSMTMFLTLVKATPKSAGGSNMATIATIGSEHDPRTFSTTAIVGNPIGPASAAYLRATIPSQSDSLILWGALVLYTTP